MIEILPIGFLNDEDSPLFGSLNVLLGQLSRSGFPVSSGIVITPPSLHLQTTLEHYDFNSKEVFEQNLTLVKKEIAKIPVPEILTKETGNKNLWLGGQTFKNAKELWLALLDIWLTQVKTRLWEGGFQVGLTANLEPQIVIFTKKVSSFGKAFYEPEFDEAVIHIESGKLEPTQAKKLDELIQKINKKLLIPYEYDWILDGEVKLVRIKQYTPSNVIASAAKQSQNLDEIASSSTTPRNDEDRKTKTTVKVFADLSEGLVVEKDIDGVFIVGEKIFNLNRPQESFEELVFKLVESASTYPNLPILMKLADVSEGMGKVRGSLRLIHQKSLLDPMCEALLFTRNKKELKNIYLVIPFVRGVTELMQIKRELATKKLIRKNNLQIWLELCVPENIINLEEYLVTGVDGVVLNLDELSAHFNGYDHQEENLSFYKTEVAGLLKFLEEVLKLLHKNKVPFITTGSLSLNPTILEFLVERGVLGIVTQRYETHSMANLLHQAEHKMILRKTS